MIARVFANLIKNSEVEEINKPLMEIEFIKNYCLKKNKMENTEENIDILSDKDLSKFYGLSADYNCDITDSGVDDYENFVKSLDRRLIFMTIENP